MMKNNAKNNPRPLG